MAEQQRELKYIESVDESLPTPSEISNGEGAQYNSNSGGAAGIGGGNFQNRVAAWIAVQILADQAPDSLWDIPEDARLEFLRCETDNPVDDLFVHTTTANRVFIQVKKRVTLQEARKSDLGSAFDQFVRQFIRHKYSPDKESFDPIHDRCVLIVGTRSSQTILYDLPHLLKRIQSLSDSEALERAPQNNTQTEVWRVIHNHIVTFWKEVIGSKPSEADIKQILSTVRVHALDVNNGGVAEREAKNLLRSVVLLDDERVDQAWVILFENCATLAEMRLGADKLQLHARLRRSRIAVSMHRDTRSALMSRNKYLEYVCKQYNAITLPISGSEAHFDLNPIFQPLKLRRDPLAAEDLREEKRQLLLGESPRNTLRSAFQEMYEETKEGVAFITAINGEDALQKSSHKRMVVLGRPGTGKTTLLKDLLLKQARQALNDLLVPIPIFISLPDFARTGKSLPHYLTDIMSNITANSSCLDLLWQAIRYGDAFVCLDSLDEVDPYERARIFEQINIWTTLAENVWIIGSRFTEYKSGQFNHMRFDEWELLPMDHNLRLKLSEFLLPRLSQWMNRDGKTSQCDPIAFVSKLESHSQATAWGENPLLFSLAAIVFVQTDTLPASRTELYREVIELILKTREKDLLWRKLLRYVLAATALWFYKRRERIFTIDSLITFFLDVQKWPPTEAREIVQRIINSGLLEVVAHNTYGFQHQTFQEYLAAVDLARQMLNHDKSVKQYAWDFVNHKHTYSRWTEVLCLLIGVLTQESGTTGLEAASGWLKRLIDQPTETQDGDPGNLSLALAMASLREIKDVQFYNNVKFADMEKSIVYMWMEALIQAAREGNENKQRRLLMFSLEVRHLKSTLLQEIIAMLIPLANDRNGRIRSMVLKVLGNIENTPTNILIRALYDAEWDVRNIAVEALIRRGDTLATEPLLETLDHQNPYTRASAISVLGTLGKRVQLATFEKALHDEDQHVRIMCLKSLKARGNTRYLKNALNDPDEEVRSAAIKFLGMDTPTDILLKASRERSWQVRCAALEILGESNSSISLDRLNEALHDISDVVRVVAMRALKDRVPNEALREALRDPSEHVRAMALGYESKNKKDFTLEFFKIAIQDESQYVREAAAKAFGRIAGQKEIENFIDEVSKDNRLLHRAAITILAARGEDAPLEPLLEALHSPYLEVRLKAAQTLGQMSEDVFKVPLRSVLHDSDMRMYLTVAVILGEKVPIELLSKALNDPDEKIRLIAVRALGKLGGQAPIELIAKALYDQSSSIPFAALEVLQDLKDYVDCESLIESSIDEKGYIHEAIIDILNPLAKLDKVDALKAKLNEPNSRIRKLAVEALGRLKEPISNQYLIESLKDPDGEVRAVALQAVSNLGEQSLTDLIKEFLHDPHEAVRSCALSILAEHVKPIPTEIFITALRDHNMFVQTRAAEILVALKEKAPIQDILRLLEDSNGDTRGAAMQALSKLKEFVPINVFLGHLNDDSWRVRLWVMSALKTAGSPDCVNPLLVCLDDESWSTRQDAIEALGNLGVYAPTDSLLSALADENEYVRDAAANALQKISPELLYPACNEASTILLKQGKAIMLAPVSQHLIIEFISNLGRSEPILFEKLMEFLSSTNWQIQLGAVKALGNIRRSIPDDIIKYLLTLRRDASKDSVRKAADEALAELLSLETGIEDD